MKRSVINKLIRALKRDKILVFIDTNINTAGEVDGLNILINPLLGDRILTLLHEYLHIINPETEEEEIEKMAIELLTNLSSDDELLLFNYLTIGGKQ